MVNIEKQIADKIAKANGLTVTKLGLRFDKVVVRLLGNLRDSVEKNVPKGAAVLLTVTAPIKLPAKTGYEIKEQIENLLRSGIRHEDKETTVFQNAVRIRTVDTSSNQPGKFIGFVHNPDCSARLLLDLASRWLLEN